MGTSIMPTLPHFLSVGPSLQTPRPTQPYNDPRYHHLLESRVYPQTPRHSTPSSSNPSPSSTLCSSGSGTTLVLDEEMVQIKKAFELWPPSPLYLLASSSYTSSSCNDGNRSKVEYQSWMLNPDSASYAPLFPPIDSPTDMEPGEEDRNDLDADDPFTTERGPTRNPISPPPLSYLPIQRPPKRQRTAPYRHVHPRTPWSGFFQRGCRSRNRDAIFLNARKIVSSQRWDGDDTLLGLVHAFVRHAVDVNVEAQERESVAVFATRVHDAFRMTLPSIIPCPNKRLDLRFKELMREVVLATFSSCWHHAPEHLNAITYTLPHTPPPSYLAYVTSALHLCSFIGDLYAEKLLSRTDTVGCVRIILYNLSLVDHITAIGNILKRAGTALWKEASFPIAGFGCIDNLDREVGEFEKQMGRALHVVQDHRYLFAASRTDEAPGNRSAPLNGIVVRKVESLIRYVRECKRFASEGHAADGVLVAICPE